MKKKEQLAPYIKLKYFTKPRDGKGGEDFICFQCKKRSDKIGSGNVIVNPPEYRCEKCAISNYAMDYGFQSLKVAESHRRRIFDVFYLFQEMVIDKILKEEKKTFKEMTNEEHNKALEVASEIWKDERAITQEEKEDLENLYYQKDIEEEINYILDSVSLHRVDLG